MVKQLKWYGLVLFGAFVFATVALWSLDVPLVQVVQSAEYFLRVIGG